MKKRRFKSYFIFCAWLPALALSVFAFATRAQTSATLTIQADQPGAQISSNLFGIFFEEINSAGDGGIYAEMVRNRSFEDPGHTNYWQLMASGAAGTMSADSSVPLSAGNLFSLKLTRSSGSGTVGIANNGFWGMNFQAGQTYDLNLYARCTNGFTGALTVRLENASGSQVYAQGTASGLTTTWQRFSFSLVPSASDTTGRLALAISQAGTVWLDTVSIFPRQTFHSRTNGLRPDLANLLSNLAPAFVRFPGGCFVEGDYLTNAFRWKNSVGDIAARPGHWNAIWSYYSSDGLGYHEYLQLCEDLGAEPLFVINCGMAHNEVVSLNQMGPWVLDALDAIEYANGPTNSTWGALRAAAGHPAPFHLKYIEIGNENGGAAYNDRYALFYDVIKTNYPDIHIVANNWGSLPTSRPVEISDEHYYSDPGFFMANANKYDSYSRTGPKVYVGEYAVTTGAGNGNLAAALGEAAFMTGLERNSDVVTMSSYAPLFANLNNKNWNPDLIYFTSSQAYGTPSYYGQQMFAQNRGDVVLPLAISFTGGAANPLPHGAIGLGSWNTSVQYTNIAVISNGVPLYQSDFVNSGTNGWRVYRGTWGSSSGIYQQTAITTDCRSTTGGTNWGNYTITLRGRKASGSEGFLILFNWLNDTNWTWWNIGGWNNTQNAIEQMVNGTKSTIGQSVSGSVQPGRWYDIRIVLNGTRIQCYLDNTLVQEADYPLLVPLYASASYAQASGQIILKTVNVSTNPVTTTFNLNGLPSVALPANLKQLTSTSSLDENSLALPTRVFPVTTIITNAGTNFVYTFPANSLSILRLQTPPTLPIQVDLKVGTNLNDLASLPDGIPVGLNSFVTNAVAVDYRIETADGRFVTNGTFQIVPGILTTNLPLPDALLQPGAFFRVTLSNPINGQLGDIPRGYFAADSLPGAPLKIGLALYPDETLVYWTDPTATLLEATNVIGPWTTNFNAAKPVRIPDSPAAEFFRLMR